jgi:hypothetical protein
MATLWITEYDKSGHSAQLPLAFEPGTDQTVTFTTAAQSNAFAATTTYVRLYGSIECHIKFGSDPTATATSQKIAADTAEWRRVNGGDKVSVYDGSS